MRSESWVIDKRKQFEVYDPILHDDQIGYATDTKEFWVGDGNHHWSELPVIGHMTSYQECVQRGLFAGTEDEFYKALLATRDPLWVEIPSPS